MDFLNKIKPCYICGDKHGKKDKHHPSRCLECKRDQSRFYSLESRQRALEKKALSGESDVYLCLCGDYYVSINKKHDFCKACRKVKQ